MTSRGRDSVAETGTPASALYVIESAANGARLHFPPSLRIEQEVEKLEGCTTAVRALTRAAAVRTFAVRRDRYRRLFHVNFLRRTDAVAAELHQVRLLAQAHRFLSRVVERGATRQRQSRVMCVIHRLDSCAYDG